MKKVTLLAAAAAVSALVATPVMARDNVRSQSGAHMKSAKHQARMQNRAMYRDRTAYRQNNWDRRDAGFGPGAVAGGIVGGAIGTAGAVTAGALNTAGAIATAPFGGPYYNNIYYNRGPYYGDAGWRGSYASADTMGWDDSGYGYAGYDNPGYGSAAYDYNGVAIPGASSFDARNGFTCRPGSVTKMGNQRVICQ
ncbi:hypothetical protein V1291_002225 [Nitrobacteraceae bacterium AZCC 1564]